MRSLLPVLAGILVLGVLDASCVGYQMHHRAKEMTGQTANITIRAGGFLNTDLEIFDADPHADILSDLDAVRERSAAYKKLGFVTVSITTLHDEIRRSL
jgi:hypothetical protein